jgi:hypothetical protein
MAPQAIAAGPLEGMEASENQAAQPDRAGNPTSEAAQWAYSGKGYWRISGSPVLTRALPNDYWADQGGRPSNCVGGLC